MYELFSSPGQFHKDLLAEIKVQIGRNIHLFPCDNAQGNTIFGVDHDIQQCNNLEETKKLIMRGASSMVHDTMKHPFAVLDAMLNWILMLAM